MFHKLTEIPTEKNFEALDFEALVENIGIELSWEMLKNFPNESINKHLKLKISGVPNTPELLEVLARVLKPHEYGFGLRPDPVIITHEGVHGVTATFINGFTSENAGRPLPSKSEAVAAGIVNKSYRTQRYGLVDNFSGRAIMTMPDGRRFQANGIKSSGDAWTAYQGGILFDPIVRKEKLELKEVAPLQWGSVLLDVFCDQFGNRYAFHEGAKKPHVCLPFWRKEWREGKTNKAIFWDDRSWIGDEGFCVNISKEALTEEELLLVKYTQEDSLPKVEVIV